MRRLEHSLTLSKLMTYQFYHEYMYTRERLSNVELDASCVPVRGTGTGMVEDLGRDGSQKGEGAQA